MLHPEEDDQFERKDEIRQRLRIVLRLTTPKQKSRLLYGLVGLQKKGFHCRTRDELSKLDSFLRVHFPHELANDTSISCSDMEMKLRALDGDVSSELTPSTPKRESRARSDSGCNGSGSAISSTTASDGSDASDDEEYGSRAHKRPARKLLVSAHGSPASSGTSKRRANASRLPVLMLNGDDDADEVSLPTPQTPVRCGPSVLRQTPRSPFAPSIMPHVFTFPSYFESSRGCGSGYHPGLSTLPSLLNTPVDDPEIDIKAALALVNMAQHMDAIVSQRSPRPIDFC